MGDVVSSSSSMEQRKPLVAQKNISSPSHAVVVTATDGNDKSNNINDMSNAVELRMDILDSLPRTSATGAAATTTRNCGRSTRRSNKNAVVVDLTMSDDDNYDETEDDLKQPQTPSSIKIRIKSEIPHQKKVYAVSSSSLSSFNQEEELNPSVMCSQSPGLSTEESKHAERHAGTAQSLRHGTEQSFTSMVREQVKLKPLGDDEKSTVASRITQENSTLPAQSMVRSEQEQESTTTRTTHCQQGDVRSSKRKRAPPGRFQSSQYCGHSFEGDDVDKGQNGGDSEPASFNGLGAEDDTTPVNSEETTTFSTRKGSRQKQPRMPKKPRRRPLKAIKGLASEEQEQCGSSSEKHEFDEPVVGTRVYARWPENDSWYWGHIFDITKAAKRSRGRGTTSAESFYRIRFDDGDERTLVPRTDFITEQVYNFGERYNLVDNEAPSKPQKPSRKPNGRKRSTRGGRKPKPPKQKEIVVGTRCYAKFTDGGWHWGTITQVRGTGVDMTCSVQYDDGDTRDNIRVFDEIMTEADHRPEYLASNCAELDIARCRKCVFCVKPDCGHCSACLANKYSTSIYKECCFFRGCTQLDIAVAGKPIPNFPSQLRYHFTEALSKLDFSPLHPALVGFSVVDLKSRHRKFSCIESAGVFAGVSTKNIRKAEKDIYVECLGLKIRQSEENVLVGKGYCRQWLQLHGRHAFIYGIVESCERDRFDERLVFQVRYTEESLASISTATVCSSISKVSEVGERVAWAGCQLYEEKVCCQNGITAALADTNCAPLRWMLPEMIRYDHLPPDRFSNGDWRPKQTMIFRGFKLELETRKSSIPNAGLGVFLRCTSVDNSPRDTFELPNGEMLDIGTYAPLTCNDFKDGSLFLFKNFIYDGSCEGWSFDAAGCEPGRKLFDITDDATGELHDTARMNALSYVNETNGIEIPSVRADHDVEGSVHYLLGHFQTDHGPLVFPTEKWMEIKIDYGPTYEDVRVRKGYSRLSKAELAKAEQNINDDDKNTLEDIGSWSVRDIELCLLFLERKLSCLENDGSLDSVVARKALLISIRLYMRLEDVWNEFESLPEPPKSASSSKVAAIAREAAPPSNVAAHAESSTSSSTASAFADYCDNGFSSMYNKRLIPRFRECIKKLLNFWTSDVELKNMLLRESYSAFYIIKLLNCETMVLRRMSSILFRAELEKNLGIFEDQNNDGERKVTKLSNAGNPTKLRWV
ncbi:hypothetical protein ACA910_018089 [Epithemia clementina (nom. ined.)]